MWMFIYIVVFIVVFTGSAVFKIIYNPFNKNFTVKWSDSVGKTYTDISYGNGKANRFDLYLPSDKSKETYGLVVYLHAGGFTEGDKSEDADILKLFCLRGYVAAGINYTLFGKENPMASVYSQSLEIKQSIPVIVEEAGNLGYKLDRMAIAGGSSGGTLALIYAYRDADTSPIPVKLVFEMVGPPSFHHEDWTTYGLDKSPEAAAKLFSTMAGKIITSERIIANDYDDEIKDISPYMWVNKNSPPTLCAYGKRDKVCPFLSVRHLINAFKENNVPYEYLECPHSGHGLQNDNKLLSDFFKKLKKYFKEYMGT